jgi:hypothetical protein
MKEHMDESFLPRVDETDLAQILFEDITDPTHRERWRHHSRLNPTLAREILNRAYVMDVRQLQNPLEVTKLIIDSVTFALSAIEAATKRTHTENGDAASASS